MPVAQLLTVFAVVALVVALSFVLRRVHQPAKRAMILTANAVAMGLLACYIVVHRHLLLGFLSLAAASLYLLAAKKAADKVSQ